MEPGGSFEVDSKVRECLADINIGATDRATGFRLYVQNKHQTSNAINMNSRQP
jgi:hypothetical protein